MKWKIRFIDIIFAIAIIGADLFVYIILGLLLMGYDDNYEISKGAYGSWASMNASEKAVHVCFLTWNAVNLLGLIYFIRKNYVKFKFSGKGTEQDAGHQKL